jgi:hypothetical protein
LPAEIRLISSPVLLQLERGLVLIVGDLLGDPSDGRTDVGDGREVLILGLDRAPLHGVADPVSQALPDLGAELGTHTLAQLSERDLHRVDELRPCVELAQRPTDALSEVLQLP